MDSHSAGDPLVPVHPAGPRFKFASTTGLLVVVVLLLSVVVWAARQDSRNELVLPTTALRK